ncbi:histidine kinase [Micromonospora sp. NPDC005298]|uniref:sensor histidine kinase n=1 Tax=Micromonospora sp. NPDC005298 TaxID=3156873 RepID=UPI0033B597B5
MTAQDGSPEVTRLRLVILAALLAVQVSVILAAPMPAGQQTGCLAAVAALAVLQGMLFLRAARNSGLLRTGVLAVQGLATYLPLLTAGAAWPGMGGFLAASVLLVVPGPAAWALSGTVVVSLFAAALALGTGLRDANVIAVASLAIGLTMFAPCRLTDALGQAHSRHAEQAQLAVVRERLRFARDLHDLLGYSLNAITLRAELARRLMTSDPVSAGNELREVVATSREACADVRQVADGYRNISLAQEVASAAALLARADIAVSVEMNCGMLPDKVDSVLAMILRELITNVLRHSSARNCWITAEQTDEHVTLSVANDGVPRTAAVHRHGGGLENLAFRLEAVGGTLSATVRDNGRFHVLAAIASGADAPVGVR